MIKNVKTTDLFDLERTIAKDIFNGRTYPWEVLPEIKAFVIELGKKLPKDLFTLRGENVWVANSCKIYPNVYIDGPCIIDEGTEIRPGAFIRGSVIVGKNCVIGNSTELKNCIIFDSVQVPHFNYVGDSILGFCSHMGAGAITSNVKSDKSLVKIKGNGFVLETGLKKVGAMLGDNVEIGCGSVLNPGTVIGKNSNVYPLSMVRGVISSDSIYKNVGEVVKKYGI